MYRTYLEYVKEGENLKGVSEKLSVTFERKGVTSRLFLLKRLLT